MISPRALRKAYAGVRAILPTFNGRGACRCVRSLNADLRRWLQSSSSGPRRQALQQRCAPRATTPPLRGRRSGRTARLRPSERTAAAPPRAETARPRRCDAVDRRVLDGAANTIADFRPHGRGPAALGSPGDAVREFLSADECEQLIALADAGCSDRPWSTRHGAYDEHPTEPAAARTRTAENGLIAGSSGASANCSTALRKTASRSRCCTTAPARIQAAPRLLRRGAARQRARAGDGRPARRHPDHVPEPRRGGRLDPVPDARARRPPRRGAALYFTYCNESGETDARTLHGGTPVVRREVDCDKWLRSGPTAPRR